MVASKREQLEQRLVQLKTVRSTYEPNWRAIGEQMMPYRVVWNHGDENKGDRKDYRIINNTPIMANNTLSAGMMAGITSPARDWFNFSTVNPDLMDSKKVREYLDTCKGVVKAKFHSSNWYGALSNGVYPDLGAFGQACLIHDEDDVIPGEMNFVGVALGRYYLDNDHRNEIDTMIREVSMTAKQLVQKFGLGKVSNTVREAYDRGDYGTSFLVYHAICPNPEYIEGRIGTEGKKWASYWWEQNGEARAGSLAESGYYEFPVLAPRWSTRPGDVYGRGPGWVVRGDCQELQYYEHRRMILNDKIGAPPMRTAGVTKRMSLISGDTTEVAGVGGMFEPAIDTGPLAMQFSHVREAISEVESRINRAMYVNLWQATISDERAQRATATEVEARRQEVMLMLGPLLENLDKGLLKPAVERTFNMAQRAGYLPEPPEELADAEVEVQFISIMHQMQQTTGLVGMRTLVDGVAQMAQMWPSAIDKINADAMVDELGRITGVRPDIILDSEEVEEIRNARAQQEQEAQQVEQSNTGSQTLLNAAKARAAVAPETEDLASTMSPVAAAQAGLLSGVMG